jgi:hypothetical protein
MAHPAGNPSYAANLVSTTLRAVLRVAIVSLGSLTAIGSGGAKPALPPEVTLPPKQYRA